MHRRPVPLGTGWELLDELGKVNLVLGLLSLARLLSEALYVGIPGPRHNDSYHSMMALDVPVGFLWILSGRALRRRRPEALLLLVVVGGMALVDSAIALFLLVPSQSRDAVAAMRGEDYALASTLLSRCLLYGAQVTYAPTALAMALLNYRGRTSPGVYRRFQRAFLWFALALSLFSWGVIQLAIKGKLTRFL